MALQPAFSLMRPASDSLGILGRHPLQPADALASVKEPADCQSPEERPGPSDRPGRPAGSSTVTALPRSPSTDGPGVSPGLELAAAVCDVSTVKVVEEAMEAEAPLSISSRGSRPTPKSASLSGHGSD